MVAECFNQLYFIYIRTVNSLSRKKPFLKLTTMKIHKISPEVNKKKF